jgi:serine/threonine-protein kinase
VTVEANKAEKHAVTIRLDERLRERRGESAALAVPEFPGPGGMLGNYQIIRLLGEGGMGTVFLARDTVLDRSVALKVLPQHLLQNPDFLHRIRTEAYAQARLHHPNIVTLYSVLEIPAGFVLVLEYVEGQTLRERIQTGGPIEPGEAMAIYDQVLEGVAYAHRMGIVHRDLKPDNILLTTRGDVKIMDFGVARIVDNKEPTRSRSMVGTLLYIAPEQINGRDADFRSDIYTLGIGLFETVTGRLPFERKSDYALIHAHMLENPPRPRNLRRNLPKELEGVILKAIEKEPAKRYQNVQQFREVLLAQGQRYGLSPAGTAARNPASGRADHRTPQPNLHNRLLGGLGFDALLIVAAVLLAFALGLYPGRELPQDDVEPVTRLTVRTPSRPALDRRERAVQPATPQPPSDTKAPKDRYDSLRKAWGG